MTQATMLDAERSLSKSATMATAASGGNTHSNAPRVPMASAIRPASATSQPAVAARDFGASPRAGNTAPIAHSAIAVCSAIAGASPSIVRELMMNSGVVLVMIAAYRPARGRAWRVTNANANSAVIRPHSAIGKRPAHSCTPND
jgi:hypothetical protein